MNLSKTRTSVHCGKYVSNVKDRVQSVLRTEEDVCRFYKYLQVRNDTEPDKEDLCSVQQLKDFCASIECPHCFRRVQNTIAYSFGDSEHVPVDFLGSNPLEAISRFVEDPPSESSQFLANLHASIDMSADSFMPVGPQYGIGTFLRNLKVLLDQTVGLRWDAKQGDTSALEALTDEQNQYICMMADCVAEFVAVVFKFESTRPFKKNACVFVQALVNVFEKLFTTLFNACHKVRERFHRSSIPSLTNVNMRSYMDAYKGEASYKTALVALHILNIQRIEAFRVFYSEACDQIVMFETVFAHECARLWKYVDQDDFALPLVDSPFKFLIICQLELCLGPLSKAAEFTQGPYPTVVQELGMLEMRCTKVQQGHLEMWTRTKDRVLEQMIPDGFALTESMRADVDAARSAAVQICTMAVQEYTAKMTMAAPVIDRTFRTDPVDALRQRGILRMANLRMLCDFSFGLRHLSALASFIHDYHPAIQERVCGTDFHVRLCVRHFVLETHIQMLLDTYLEYEREETVREIMSEGASAEFKCVRNAAKKSKATKQKKMEAITTPNPLSSPREEEAARQQPPSNIAVVDDDESDWQEVRSKKKSASDPVKTKHERKGGKSNAQTKTHKSPHSRTSNSHPSVIVLSTTTGNAKRTGARNRACSPNPKRVVEPEPAAATVAPVCAPEPEPTPDPEPEPGPGPSSPDHGPEPDLEPSLHGGGDAHAGEHPEENPAETSAAQPQQSKRERRRGRGGARKQQTTATAEYPPLLSHLSLFATTDAAPIDPLILASYAASQVSQPIQMAPSQTVAVPARLFGGVLPREYASVPFMTFPRVYV